MSDESIRDSKATTLDYMRQSDSILKIPTSKPSLLKEVAKILRPSQAPQLWEEKHDIKTPSHLRESQSPNTNIQSVDSVNEKKRELIPNDVTFTSQGTYIFLFQCFYHSTTRYLYLPILLRRWTG